ncbi:MAG: hypothetical protein KKA79_07930 [Nanoarchaeota archaeon]|nr:hypothetical protein [Nanoarchaeota archaeon]
MKCYSKKGQIGMMEMIMVMVVVMVLLVVGLVFYFKFSISSMEETGERISEDKSAVVISTISNLPEVECTFLGARTSKACIDTVKLLALSIKESKGDGEAAFVTHRRHYSNLLGPMTIVFEQIYPSTEDKECDATEFSKPDYPGSWECGKWTIYDNPKKGVEDPTFITIPVALYYPSTSMYTFGQMKVFLY